jgi:hypothetical protein
MDQMTTLAKSVKRLERHSKDDYVFKTTGVSRQATFIVSVEDWVHDELKAKLEAEYGMLPNTVKEVISAGEKLLSDRFHLLKITDKWGWPAVKEFTEVELVSNEQEEKKIKKILKANEAKIDKAREANNKGRKNFSQGEYQRGRAGSNDYRYMICERGADHDQDFLLSEGTAQRRRRTTASASPATSLDTSPRIAARREPRAEEADMREKVEEEEDEGRQAEEEWALEGFLLNCKFRRNKIMNDDTHPSFSPDHLDNLEGISANMFDNNEYSEYLTGDIVDMTEPDHKWWMP